TRRERPAIAVSLAGVLVAAFAVVVGAARGGILGSVGEAWFGCPPRTGTAIASQLGDTLGPLVAVAALGGLVELGRHRLAGIAIDLRAGGVGPVTLGLAALCSAFGIARLAGSIRIASGQAIVAATCGVLMLLPMLTWR